MLIEKLAEKGHPLTFKPEIALSWLGYGPFVEHMNSYETLIREIELIPTYKEVLIKDKSLTVVNRNPAVTYEETSYEDALKRYLMTWCSRTQTILEQFERVNVDLSAGMDSRTVFAFVVYVLGKRPDLADKVRIYSSSNVRYEDELPIAKEIAEQLGLKVESVPYQLSRPQSLEMDFQNWKYNRLGQYVLAAQIPRTGYPNLSARLSGVGGADYRDFYGKFHASFEDLLLSKSRFFKNVQGPFNSFAKFKQSVESSVNIARDFPMFKLNDMQIHFREFRSRFHGGCSASERFKFLPLTGGHMDRLALVAGQERLDSLQVFHDVQHNLVPELLKHPYDLPFKTPTAYTLSNLAKVDIGELSSIEACIKMEAQSTHPLKRYTSKKMFIHLRDVVQGHSMDLPKYMDDTSRIALKKLEKAIEAKRLPSGTDMQKIHAVVLFGELSRLGVDISIRMKFWEEILRKWWKPKAVENI
ncbi:hypothetical protein [Flexibacterium corallicola]|uniref:hypothetical protein n=1 Tax=Flexibacterium corallicola TaxID=3037259 RepID=UPI00286EC2AB|nr:hypothetical protein [Pseudovibrio sp. M1P-2-3]